MMRKQVDHVNRQGLVGADELLEALHAVMHRLRARQHQALREGEQDLTPLEGMPLKRLRLDYRADRAMFLRSFTGLEFINDKPAADFWKEVDGK